MRIKLIALLAAAACALIALSGLDLLDIRPVFAEQAQQKAEAAPVATASSADAEKGILAALNRKEKELQAREEELVRNEERLNIVKADIEQRITELKREHEEIAALVKKMDEIKEKVINTIEGQK